MSETNIPVTEDARRALRVFKSEYGETYSDAIIRLIDSYEGGDAGE